MDVASVDVIWNGFAQSLKIAALAETHELACAPHNYYSHLATFIAAQWCAAIPNVRLLEIDVDDVPWREELTTPRRRSATASSLSPPARVGLRRRRGRPARVSSDDVIRLRRPRSRAAVAAVGLVALALLARALGGDYVGVTALLVAACGLVLLPFVPAELDAPAVRVAVTPALGLASFAAVLTTVSIVGIRLGGFSIPLAIAGFVVLAAIGSTRLRTPSSGSRRRRVVARRSRSSRSPRSLRSRSHRRGTSRIRSRPAEPTGAIISSTPTRSPRRGTS